MWEIPICTCINGLFSSSTSAPSVYFSSCRRINMEMSKTALAIISLISLATVHHAHAQDSPQDFLKAHNTARASVGVGPMIWDNTVAAFARNYINGLAGSCRMVHSGGPYGENLAWGSPDLAGTAAVKMWADERANYDYNSNSCVGGECLHYTQVVWRNSVRLGCAKVRCSNGGAIISCNYDPPGNYNGQRPFEFISSS
ncbi:hypothetical protein OIU76_020187 [Salix suchowensis]|uniref:CYSTEINE-RICH SECRETORY PROTEIN-RELATED n=2 Tax=Salix TaxID=40685 RepID=A0A9Q1AMX8_9ROSI|nr:hypothetical protein OIU76_020187 [Salix suchowensis]KAJ6777345.1 CYSTEINE-RICH SECRETORY PROTEIN-RELATED [Salix koriyanagi]